MSRKITPAPADPLLGIRAVAAWLAVSPSTLRRMVRDGTFPAPLRIGRSLRWRTSVVDGFLLAQESAGGA